jgi:hypothetical protein
VRAQRGVVWGWVVVVAYAALLLIVSVDAVGREDLARASDPDAAAQRFALAWERSRTATFVAEGTYERRSDVTGARLASEDVLAQRPPDRLHRQLGGVEGRRDDRLLLCPAAPAGDDAVPPCRLAPAGPRSYDEEVAREVAGVRSLTMGAGRLYAVTETEEGCFALELERADPRAPFGVDASFCFDQATGAPRSSRVAHEGGIVEVVVVAAIRTDVRDADLEP